LGLTLEEIADELDRPSLLEQTIMRGLYVIGSILSRGEVDLEEFDVRRRSEEDA